MKYDSLSTLMSLVDVGASLGGLEHCRDVALSVMSFSLEDRVHFLCDRAIAAETQAELDAVLPELKAAIWDHIRYVRALALETIPEVFGRDSNAA
jgi:hypothetical protein